MRLSENKFTSSLSYDNRVEVEKSLGLYLPQRVIAGACPEGFACGRGTAKTLIIENNENFIEDILRK